MQGLLFLSACSQLFCITIMYVVANLWFSGYMMIDGKKCPVNFFVGLDHVQAIEEIDYNGLYYIFK